MSEQRAIAQSGRLDLKSRSLKKRLAAKELTVGSWLSFGYPPMAEVMARAGFEWLVVDMEHTSIGIDQQLSLVQVIELSGIAPLVRVGANDSLLVKQALDAGAHGVIVPMVNNAADAQKAVDAAYYPPRGERGVGLSRAQGFGVEFEEYRAWAARETIVIVQIEHIEAVKSLPDILEVDGVDAFIVGPYDLSGSLGVPGEWADPAVAGALAEVESVMRVSEKPGGFHVVHSDREELRSRIEAGYRFLAYGDDMVFLAEKVAEEAAFLRSIVEAPGQ